MTALVLVLLAQAQPLNLNVQPIEVRQNGVRVPTRQRQYVVDCRTNMTCAVDGGILFLSAASGGGGAVNYVASTVVFDGGSSDALATVTAAWASSGSSLICAPADEESGVERMQVVPISKAAGSFVVRATVAQRTHVGALPFVCTGN